MKIKDFEETRFRYLKKKVFCFVLFVWQIKIYSFWFLSYFSNRWAGSLQWKSDIPVFISIFQKNTPIFRKFIYFIIKVYKNQSPRELNTEKKHSKWFYKEIIRSSSKVIIFYHLYSISLEQNRKRIDLIIVCWHHTWDIVDINIYITWDFIF